MRLIEYILSNDESVVVQVRTVETLCRRDTLYSLTNIIHSNNFHSIMYDSRYSR